MFSFYKIAAYAKRIESEKSYSKISNIGDLPIFFLDSDLIKDQFKKISAMVLIQKGGFVFIEDGFLPHADVTEFDMNNVIGARTNDAIVKETVNRIIYNAGTTVFADTLELIGVAENNDEVTYVYTAVVKNVLNNNSTTMKISQLTEREFMFKCSPFEVV
jgi:hypothetical protein